jgi:hypothetical protein
LDKDDPRGAEDVHSSIELYNVQFDSVLRRLRRYRSLFELELGLGKSYYWEVETLRQGGKEGAAALSSHIRTMEHQIIKHYNKINDDHLDDVLRERSRTGRDLDELMGMSEPTSRVDVNAASRYRNLSP